METPSIFLCIVLLMTLTVCIHVDAEDTTMSLDSTATGGSGATNSKEEINTAPIETPQKPGSDKPLPPTPGPAVKQLEDSTLSALTTMKAQHVVSGAVTDVRQSVFRSVTVAMATALGFLFLFA